jgi:hypothetical protein
MTSFLNVSYWWLKTSHNPHLFRLKFHCTFYFLHIASWWKQVGRLT